MDPKNETVEIPTTNTETTNNTKTTNSPKTTDKPNIDSKVDDSPTTSKVFESWTFLGEPVIKMSALSNNLVETISEAMDCIIDDVQNNSNLDLKEYTTDNFMNFSNLEQITDLDNDIKLSVCTNLTDEDSDHDDLLSDGISVISEELDSRCHTPISVEKLYRENVQIVHPDTPPNTPHESKTALDSIKENDYSSVILERQKRFEITPVNIVMFSLLAGITGIVLANVFKIKHEDLSILNHITPLVQRLKDLENENIILKSEVNRYKLRERDQENESKHEKRQKVIFPQPLEFYVEQNIKLNEKNVWTGDATTDEPIKILRKNFELPEFCREQDLGDDLFSEKYAKICDKKEEKLAKIIQKQNYREIDKQTKDDYSEFVKQNDSSEYDESLTTLESDGSSDVYKNESEFADDEASIDRNINDKKKLKKVLNKGEKVTSQDSSQENLKKIQLKQEKENENKRIKKVKSKNDFKDEKIGVLKRKMGNTKSDSNKENKIEKEDWVTKRKTGREEMRKETLSVNKKKSNENWYLKRGINRENQRQK